MFARDLLMITDDVLDRSTQTSDNKVFVRQFSQSKFSEENAVKKCL